MRGQLGSKPQQPQAPQLHSGLASDSESKAPAVSVEAAASAIIEKLQRQLAESEAMSRSAASQVHGLRSAHQELNNKARPIFPPKALPTGPSSENGVGSSIHEVSDSAQVGRVINCI